MPSAGAGDGALRLADARSGNGQRVDDSDEFQRTVLIAQAQGMVAAEVNCSMDDALVLMKDRAVVEGRTLEQVADAVTARTMRFGQ